MAHRFARLRGVRFVNDDGEAAGGDGAHLFGDDGEFLQRGGDDFLARFERFLQLTRAFVNGLHHAQRLLEGLHGAAQLTVEDAAVGDDDDRVEDGAVVFVVQDGKLVRQPGDGVAFAASSGVFDQVALTRSPFQRGGDQAAHGVELMVARENQQALARLPAVFVFFVVFVNEVLNQVEDAVARPNLFPQVGGGEAIEGGRVARAVVVAAIEGEEARGGAFEFDGEEDVVGVNGEVRQTAAVSEERFARVAVLTVLAHGVFDVLPRERVFEFDGEERDAVEEESHIEAVFVLLAVFQLAHDAEEVALIEFLRFGVEGADGFEVGEVEFDAERFDAFAEDIQRAAFVDFAREALKKMRFGFVGGVFAQFLPGFGLGDEDEVERVLRKQAEFFVVLLAEAFMVAACGVEARRAGAFAYTAAGFRVVGSACQQQGFDDGFKILFGGIGHGRFSLFQFL